jgi:NAD(P)-dependent dehydrogenase (short-subunit alcohol dehydrogenase family)
VDAVPDRLSRAIPFNVKRLRMLTPLNPILSEAKRADRRSDPSRFTNNAGILSNNKMQQTDLDEWRKVHTVNVEAAFLLTRALLPAMRAQRWGRFINISSYAASAGGSRPEPPIACPRAPSSA